ncbi:inner membrane protein [Halopelagius inordinatus]|uniref:Inner membrane protein n=1 Tax=Halopelagius inordinatus TaxID=553467 RepID=A0A1I2LJS4_9EURY|nr:metal-dependent hydrolase [Halopelagius inordinatus]SFF78798.1 inner membrane protein [Halopelagius inordinatus]
MVADGVHVLVALALVLSIFRSERPEAYLVAALAAAFPDIDSYIFPTLVDLGVVHGAVWTHRGMTHSLFVGVVVVLALSYFGPWRAAAVGFLSHVTLDFVTGGVLLVAPVTAVRYGVSAGWLLLNMVASVVSVAVLLVGSRYLWVETSLDRSSSDAATGVFERFG